MCQKLDGDSMNIILQNSPNGILVINPGCNLTWFNKEAENILGKNLQNYMDLPLERIFPGLDISSLICNIEKKLHKHFRIDNKAILFDCYPLYRKGSKIGTSIIFQDVSRYESIALELSSYKQLLNQLDAVIESSYDGIYITDGNAKTLRINKAYERITGIKRAEVIGKHMGELVEDGYYSQSVTLEVLKTRQVSTIRQRLKTGKEILVTGSPVFDQEGNITLVVTNVRDVTELAQLREELTEKRSITRRYQRELDELRRQLESDVNLVFRDRGMVEVIEQLRRIAPTDSTVLLLGETGVGKQLLAKYIHCNSSRKGQGSFIQVDCTTIPENLMESELFGYESGAFTGAAKEGKTGLVEMADGGTLFLDEIGELPLNMQSKLLHLLQEREFLPVGGREVRKVDLRIVAATNRNLKEMVEKRQFREDLYYRINVIPVRVPPLRERPDDIMALAVHFLNECNRFYNLNRYFSPECLKYLCKLQWPGNVRQLKNLVERAALLSENDKIDSFGFFDEDEKDIKSESWDNVKLRSLRTAVEDLEKSLIKQALKETNSSKEAASVLGIDSSTLWRKMKKLGL